MKEVYQINEHEDCYCDNNEIKEQQCGCYAESFKLLYESKQDALDIIKKLQDDRIKYYTDQYNKDLEVYNELMLDWNALVQANRHLKKREPNKPRLISQPNRFRLQILKVQPSRVN